MGFVTIDDARTHRVFAVQVAAAREGGERRVERFFAQDAELEENATEVGDGFAGAAPSTPGPLKE